MSKLFSLFVLFSLMLVLHGCVSKQSFSTAARAGETVVLAIGSLDGANESNITAVFSPNADPLSQTSLPIRSVFNIYPEKTSVANFKYVTDTNSSSLNNIKGLLDASAHAAWLTIAVIDLPSSLPAGSGQISFTTGLNVVSGENITKIDDIVMGLDILPEPDPSLLPAGGEIAPASNNMFEYFAAAFNGVQIGNLDELKSVRKFVVRPKHMTVYGQSSTSIVSAAEYKINVELGHPFLPGVNPNHGVSVIYEEVITDFNQSIDVFGNPVKIAAQTQMSYNKSGNILTVNLISPTGRINLDYVRFSIVPFTESGYDLLTTPTIISAKYFDQDGKQTSHSVIPDVVEVNS